MENAIIKYGICAANDDPWGIGRIRVIIDGDMIPPLKIGTDVEKLLAKYDSDNIKKNGNSAYVPWELGVDYKAPDPYLFEPFLPKHLNLIPKVGESVKIIYYVLNDEVQQREYVCQHTSNYDSLTYDSGEHARSFTKLSTTYRQQKNYKHNGLIPNINDVALIGRKNSDLILPENEVYIRAGQQDFFNDKKNIGAALIQASYFLNRKNLITEIVNENISPVVFINNIVEFYMDKIVSEETGIRLTTKLFIYSVPSLDTKNYNPYVDYFKDQDKPSFLVDITGKTNENIISFIQTFLKNLDKNNVNLNLTGELTNFPENNNNLKYKVTDNRTSQNGEPLDNFYSLGLYQFRPSPLNNLSDEDINSAVVKLPAELRPKNKKPTQKFETKEEEKTVDNPDFDETAIISGADKMFMLSWKGSKNLQNLIGDYGFSQEDMYLTLQKRTDPIVRGDLLLNLVLDVLDLVLSHGHATGVDAVGSLNKGAVDKIAEIKEKYALLAKVNKDLSGGSDILNQYLRIN